MMVEQPAAVEELFAHLRPSLSDEWRGDLYFLSAERALMRGRGLAYLPEEDWTYELVAIGPYDSVRRIGDRLYVAASHGDGIRVWRVE